MPIATEATAAAMNAMGMYPDANMLVAQGSTLSVPVAIAVAICTLILLAFWIWMIVHVIRKEPRDQALWALVLLLTNVAGAVVYFFAVKRKMDKAAAGESSIRIV